MGMARMVDKEAHGVFVLISALMIFVGMIAQAGIGYGLIQRKINKQEHISFAFYSSVFLGILFCSVMWLLSPIITSIYGNSFDPIYLQVASVSLFFINLSSVSRSLLIKEFQFKKIFIAQCGSYLLGNILIGFYLAYNQFELWAFVLGFVAFNAIGSLFYYLLKPHSLRYKFSVVELKETWYFSSSFTLSEILNNAGHFIDKMILGGILTPSILAIYEKGQQTARLPVRVIGNTFDIVFYSLLTKIQDNQNRIRKLYLNVQGLSVFLAVIMFSILFIFAKHIVVVLLGANWMDSIPILRAFAIPFSLAVLSKHADVIFRVKNKLFLASRIKLIFLLLVIASVFLSTSLQVNQIAYSISFSFILFYLLNIHYSLKIMNINWKDFILSISNGLLYGIIIYTVNYGIMVITEGNLGRVISLATVVVLDLVITLLLIRLFPHLFGKNNLIFLLELSQLVKLDKYLKMLNPSLLNNE